MYLTRNQAWWQHHRGFESLPPFPGFMTDGPKWPVLYFYLLLYLSLGMVQGLSIASEPDTPCGCPGL